VPWTPSRPTEAITPVKVTGRATGAGGFNRGEERLLREMMLSFHPRARLVAGLRVRRADRRQGPAIRTA